MNTAEQLLELASRVEKAEGPDRELDEEIAALLEGATREVQSDGRSAYYRGNTWVSVGPIQPFTASIDAAASLVPEGLSFEVRRSGTGDKGQALVWDPMGAPGAYEWRVRGCATPALALTAASLRARAAEVGK